MHSDYDSAIFGNVNNSFKNLYHQSFWNSSSLQGQVNHVLYCQSWANTYNVPHIELCPGKYLDQSNWLFVLEKHLVQVTWSDRCNNRVIYSRSVTQGRVDKLFLVGGLHISSNISSSVSCLEPSYQEEFTCASLCSTPAVYGKYLGVIFTLKPWPVLKQRPLVSGVETIHEVRYAVASAD